MSSNTMKIALTFTAIDAASGIVLGLEKRILGMGKDAEETRRHFENMVGSLRSGLKSLAFSKYIFDSLKPVLKLTADMEESFTTLEMSLQKTGENAAVFREELEKIKDTAGKVQLLFPASQKEFIDAATILAQSGMSREDIANPKGALYSVGALSSIGKVSTEYSAQLMSQAANVFGLKGERLSEFADWSQRIGTSTLLHIKDQAQALSEGGAAAGILKIGYKDTLTAMGAISQMEGGPSKAGERFAEFGQRIMGATKEEKKALKTAGFDFFDKKGNLKSFPLIVKNLQGLESGLKKRGFTEQQILDLWKKIFQGRGEYAAYALGKTGDNSFEDVQKRAEDSLGIQAKVDKALEDMNTQVRALTGSVKTLVEDAFDPLLKSLTPIVRTINDAIGPLDSFVKEHRTLMKDMGIGVGILLGLNTARAILRIAQAAMSFTKVLTGVGVATSGAAVGTRALAGAVAALNKYLGPFMLGWEAGKKIKESEENYADKRAQMQGEFSGAKDYYSKLFERMDISRDHPVENSLLENAVSRLAEAWQERPKNDITLNINVDQSGRVTTKSNDPDTRSTINLKRGDFDFTQF